MSPVCQSSVVDREETPLQHCFMQSVITVQNSIIFHLVEEFIKGQCTIYEYIAPQPLYALITSLKMKKNTATTKTSNTVAIQHHERRMSSKVGFILSNKGVNNLLSQNLHCLADLKVHFSDCFDDISKLSMVFLLETGPFILSPCDVPLFLAFQNIYQHYTEQSHGYNTVFSDTVKKYIIFLKFNFQLKQMSEEWGCHLFKLSMGTMGITIEAIYTILQQVPYLPIYQSSYR